MNADTPAQRASASEEAPSIPGVPDVLEGHADPEPHLGLHDLESLGASLSESLGEAMLVVQDLMELAPPEVLPFEPLPALTLGAAAVAPAATGWLARLLAFFARHAYLMAFAGALVENTVLLGFLLPGGTIVALAAAGARTGGLPLLPVVVLAAAGMTAGAVLDYFVGRSGLARLLRHPRAGRLGRFLSGRLEDTAPLLARHGWWMMLLAHAFGHGRSSMAVAAGATRLPLRRFLVMEVPAAALWGAAFGAGGYALGGEWHMLELAFRRAGWAGAAVAILGALAWFLHSRRQAQRRPGADGASAAPGPTPLPLGAAGDR